MDNENKEPKLLGKVCKNVHWSVSKIDKLKDLTAAKITNVYDDGSRKDEYLLVENYKVDYYLVKPKYRKFTQKKDYYDMDKCDKFKCNYARIASDALRRLTGKVDHKAELDMVKNNPYIFGCEQTVPVILKAKYFKAYNKYQTIEPYKVGFYDVETEIDNPDNPVMMASLTFNDKVYFAGNRNWFKRMDKDVKTDEDIIRKLKENEEYYLKERLGKRNAKVIYELFDHEGDIVENCIKIFHKWHPDYIVSWHARYDMECNETALNRFHRDVTRIYCDPAIPDEYTYYRLDKGRTHKRKENGDMMPLEPQEIFPTIRCMAQWEWFDYMSFHAIKNAPKGKKDSYKLHDIAEELGIEGKLKMKGEEGERYDTGTPDWHRYYQKHPYFYAMYNINDNLVMEDMNEKTNEVSLSFPLLIKTSEFFNYPSQPRVISDELSHFALENGKVWGTVGRDSKKDEFDQYKPTLNDWIALLDTELVGDLGYQLFEGLDVKSRGRGSTNDIDVEGAYPTAGSRLNVSNTTTMMEACEIEGCDPTDFRKVGINFITSPWSNAIYLCNKLHGFPDIVEVEDYLKENHPEVLQK